MPTPRATASGGWPTPSQQGTVHGEWTEPEMGSAEWGFWKTLGPAFLLCKGDHRSWPGTEQQGQAGGGVG